VRSDLPPPPRTRTVDLVEELHGVPVADPYRWLEQGEAPEVRRWVDEQNEFTRSLLQNREGRADLRRRLSELLSIGTITPPRVRNGRYFFIRRDGGDQDQPVLYVREGPSGRDRALIDPNVMSEDGTTAIDWWYPSRDGALVAYGVSTRGDEKSTLKIIEVDSGKDLPDRIPHTRYCSLAWLLDGSGFYYTRYPAPGEVAEGEENYNRHLYLHRIGDDPATDRRIFGDGRRPEEMIDIDMSPDGRHLVIMVQEGWRRSDLYVRDLTREDDGLLTIAEGIDALFTGEVIDGTLYLHTNWKASRYRLLAVDLQRPEQERWRTLLPERKSVLSQARVVGDRIVTLELENASSRVRVFAMDGRPLREIALPALGTVDQINGPHDGHEAFFDFSSYGVPPTVFRYDVERDEVDVWSRIEAPVNLDEFEVKQVFYPSKDGRRISMFVVHRKGIELNGSHPTLLYGYGGFNINLTPRFSPSRVMWLERGGIYAEANLRGGGEYGEEWHRAGMLDNKQKVFDDFIAAADWLVAERYTERDRLAIMGGSNGGLLVGAALTQRPEMFRAVVCMVPLLDMVRYENFRIARLWAPEFGSASDPEQFRWLHAYSPYHRVEAGTAYPAILIGSAECDSRVDPMHACKMAARLQAGSSSGLPVLLRMETEAGHGAGKPVSKVIDASTDVWSFLFWQLGMEGEYAQISR
jgi:prolyl oligopeptidase